MVISGCSTWTLRWWKRERRYPPSSRLISGLFIGKDLSLRFASTLKVRAAESWAAKYSAAADYFDMASAALEEIYKLVGYARFDKSGHMTRGVLTRHLVLPGLSRDSMKLLDYLASHYDVSRFALSLMSQYFPTKACAAYPEINRHVTTLEYERVVHHAETLGFTCGFLQERTSAKEEYVPAFDYKPKTEEQTEER